MIKHMKVPHKPKYKRGDGVIIEEFGIGMIISEPELDFNDEERTLGEWSYLISFNEINDWGWFAESECKDLDDIIRDIEGQE